MNFLEEQICDSMVFNVVSSFDLRFIFWFLVRQMHNGKEFLLTDTVGFIQKLPTTLVRP